MPGWARTFWVGVVLIVPGGFLLFLGYAFGRALLRTKRAAAANASDGEARPHRFPTQVTLKDVLREVRTSI